MIAYRCPSCSRDLTVHDSRAGCAYVCPGCDTQTTVPGSRPGPTPALATPPLARKRRARGEPILENDGRQLIGCVSLAVPVVGLIIGLAYAFNADPVKKERASVAFACAVIGVVLAPLWWLAGCSVMAGLGGVLRDSMAP